MATDASSPTNDPAGDPSDSSPVLSYVPKGAFSKPKEPEQKPSPVLVGAAAWLVPGAGYWLLGERARGVTVGVTVVSVFLIGLLVGGVRVLEVPTYDHAGRDVNDTWLHEVRAKPWSIAQIMTGPVGIAGGALCVYASRPSAAPPFLPPGTDSHARVNEIAVLYTAVAGMLNLLAIIDSCHRAGAALEAK